MEDSEELQEFLRHVEHSDRPAPCHFSSERMQKLHDRVLSVKQNEGIEVKYMQLWEEKIMEREEGLAAGAERVSQLNLLLIEQKRYDDLEKAAKDRGYREQLFKEFSL